MKVRLFGRHPLLARVVVWLVLPLLLGTGALWLTLRHSLPQVQGQLVVPGLTAPVRVARDAAGVPHIGAASDADAFFALGYVHAQERMWQMDYKRRLGQGRLSEIAGVAALPGDKLMRTLGLSHAAEQ
ncbi:MAG TPA: penicillin acylase family protein, partial [Duganella sp.]|nr:penicillin acylase family protein [Duganella sp.]